MAIPEHRTGSAVSGDVTVFYRVFGKPGRTPVLIMHGANYFDSYDWMDVAAGLATDREVVCYDKRGFGASSWSDSKDYSLDAHVTDAMVVAGRLGWKRFIPMGHSASGRLSVAIAANYPDRAAALIVADAGMGGDEGGGAQRQTTGNAPLIFDSVEAAMASFAKLGNPPRIAHDRVRAEAALVKVEQGFMLKRDPDFQNARPVGESADMPQRPAASVWEDLARVSCPVMFVRGLKSDRWKDPKILERLAREFPKIVINTVDAQHDVADQAPAALIAHVRRFIDAIPETSRG